MAVWLSEVKSPADARMYMPKIAKWTLLTSTASCASRPTTAAVVSSRTSTCATSLWGNVKEAVVKINLDYEPKEICYRGFEPSVSQVYVENVTCKKSNYGVLIVGREQGRENVTDITVKNCKFDGVIKQPVKITGKTRDVKFDNLIINGSLVLNKEDRPYQTYSEWLTHSEMSRVAHPYLLDFSSKPKWSYVMGIEMEGMLDTYLYYKDNKSTFKGKDAEANNEAILNYLKGIPCQDD